MKRDAIYYQIFKQFPSLLFTLLEQPPEQARDYRFESIEVKEPRFRIDGVFLPPEDASPKVIYFSEIQFQKDEELYDRFFAESLLYLYRNPSIYDDWYGVVIYPSRKLEPKNTTIHRSLLNGPQVTRIYLDELGEPENQPVGIQLMQLTTVPESQMATKARQLMERVQEEESPLLPRQDIIEVLTTIAVYKFADLSREEVEAMLGVNLEETRVYREAKAEGEQIGEERGEQKGKLATVPLLLKAGLTVEQIAEQLGLELAVVQKAAHQ
ncbi:MAG: Rpn family recombination-promoting nuclease/putative transposase [Thermosynechococcaceae cyanobacterium]